MLVYAYVQIDTENETPGFVSALLAEPPDGPVKLVCRAHPVRVFSVKIPQALLETGFRSVSLWITKSDEEKMPLAIAELRSSRLLQGAAPAGEGDANGVELIGKARLQPGAYHAWIRYYKPKAIFRPLSDIQVKDGETVVVPFPDDFEERP